MESRDQASELMVIVFIRSQVSVSITMSRSREFFCFSSSVVVQVSCGLPIAQRVVLRHKPCSDVPAPPQHIMQLHCYSFWFNTVAPASPAPWPIDRDVDASASFKQPSRSHFLLDFHKQDILV